MTEEISELQRILFEVRAIEQQLETYLRTIPQTESLRYDRCSDHGQRSVTLVIPFDTLNVLAFKPDVVANVCTLISQHVQLRDRQRKLELKVAAEMSPIAAHKNQFGTL